MAKRPIVVSSDDSDKYQALPEINQANFVSQALDAQSVMFGFVASDPRTVFAVNCKNRF